MRAENDRAGRLTRRHLRSGPALISFAVALVLGAGGALFVVLGKDVLVNPLLAIAAGAVHALATILIATVVIELVNAIRDEMWSDLPPLVLVPLALLGAGCVVVCVVIDRLVAHSRFPDHYDAVYVTVVLLMSLAALAVTVRVLRPDRHRGQTLAVSAILAVVGLVTGVLFIGGWAGFSAYQRNRQVPNGPELARLAPIEGITGTYVALGDSYSAGEGLRPFDQFTTSDQASGGTGCHRSSRAYPRLLRFASPSPAELFVACSGAVKHDLYAPHRRGDRADAVVVAPQLDDKVHPEVGLVTLSIGGNDVVFSKVVVHCFLHVDCLDSTFRSPRDDPGRDLRFPPTQPLRSWADDALVLVRTKVDDLYPKLRAQFPNARIIVVGYPYLFPDRGAPVFDLSDCQSILRRFSRGERRDVRALQDELNATLYEAAVGAGIEFVSPAAGWNGHEPCGTDAQYTNSIKPFVQFETAANIVDGGTFHPNAAGQRELARLVTCYLAANRERPALDAAAPAPGSLANPVPGC